MSMHEVSPPLSRLLGQTADAVAAVRSGRSLTEVLAACPPALRGGTQALSFQVLRTLGGAEAALALMAPKTPPPAVSSLLVTALALLWPGDDAPPYAEHTLVDQAVTSARARTPMAANFVNAVLRRFLRERTVLVAQAQRSPVAVHNHPLWWIEQVRQDWPAQWVALLAAANRHPPMVLRANARRGDAAAYLRRLAEDGRPASVPQDPLISGQAVVLHSPCGVTALPGFADGEVSVQDLSAQRAAALLLGGGATGIPRLPAGARVLDACAAPGGTDSGGLQEEAAWFAVPTIVLRATTPRPEGVALGFARLAGVNATRVMQHASELVHPEALTRIQGLACPYGDGHTAPRIARAVAEAFSTGRLHLREPALITAVADDVARAESRDAA